MSSLPAVRMSLPDDGGRAAAFSVIDLRLEQNAQLVLIEKLKLIQRLIEFDPQARVVVLTARTDVAAAIEGAGVRMRRYLANTDDAERLGLTPLSGEDEGPVAGASAMASIDAIEWAHIQRVLALNKGNKRATARALKIHCSTLRRKLARPPSQP